MYQGEIVAKGAETEIPKSQNKGLYRKRFVPQGVQPKNEPKIPTLGKQRKSEKLQQRVGRGALQGVCNSPSCLTQKSKSEPKIKVGKRVGKGSEKGQKRGISRCSQFPRSLDPSVRSDS